jgi:hypothetical protein
MGLNTGIGNPYHQVLRTGNRCFELKPGLAVGMLTMSMPRAGRPNFGYAGTVSGTQKLESYMFIRKLILLIAMSGLMVTSSGCLAVVAGAGAGAGYVAYRRGELVAPVDVSAERAAAATSAAFRELNLPELSRNQSMEGITFVTRDADDKKITVFCEVRTPESANIHIRVGTFGDEDTSRLIYNAITNHL